MVPLTPEQLTDLRITVESEVRAIGERINNTRNTTHRHLMEGRRDRLIEILQQLGRSPGMDFVARYEQHDHTSKPGHLSAGDPG